MLETFLKINFKAGSYLFFSFPAGVFVLFSFFLCLSTVDRHLLCAHRHTLWSSYWNRNRRGAREFVLIWIPQLKPERMPHSREAPSRSAEHCQVEAWRHSTLLLSHQLSLCWLLFSTFPCLTHFVILCFLLQVRCAIFVSFLLL